MKLHLSIESRIGTRGASRAKTSIKGLTMRDVTEVEALARVSVIRARADVVEVKAVLTETDLHGKITREQRI